MKIKKIQLKSKKLKLQKLFYTEQLGFELLQETEDNFTIQTGSTQITFERSSENYYYHFAFNIPSFQIKEAFEWLESKKVTFIPYEGSYFIDFKNWNADAVYFYDADENIVELIARKNMAIELENEFSINSILGLSEIGMPVLDVTTVFHKLTKELELKQYSGDQHYFCVLGDEEGLLLIVDQKSKKWMPTESPAIAVPFIMELEYQGRIFDFEYDGRIQKINLHA